MGREIDTRIGYWKLHSNVVEHVNGMRAIAKKVDSPQFEKLWKQSTDEQRKEALKLVYSGDRNLVTDWMENHPSLKAEEWGYNRLRDRAQKLGVKNYCRITRDELIQAIMEKESANDED